MIAIIEGKHDRTWAEISEISHEYFALSLPSTACPKQLPSLTEISTQINPKIERSS